MGNFTTGGVQYLFRYIVSFRNTLSSWCPGALSTLNELFHVERGCSIQNAFK